MLDAGVRLRDLRLTDFKYAEDICLLAASPEQLQALPDALHTYCKLICMTVSSEKTKVMVMFDVVQSHFCYDGEAIDRVASYKYLGLHFHDTGAIASVITPFKAMTASSWTVVQQSMHICNVVILPIKS